MALYHYTDTSRLPWILSSGELRPGANEIGGYPDPEFVWATTNSLGDRTASVARGAPYQSGRVRHVRFTLDSADFVPWAEVPQAFPKWTAAHVERLNASGIRGSDPREWWCSARPILSERWLAVHSRSWADNRCREFDPSTYVARMADDDGTLWLGVEVAGLPFTSARLTAPDGRTGYMVR